MTSVAMLVAWSAMRSRLRADDDALQSLRRHDGPVLNHFDKLHLRNAIHTVDLIVHLADGFGHLGIAVEQRL